MAPCQRLACDAIGHKARRRCGQQYEASSDAFFLMQLGKCNAFASGIRLAAMTGPAALKRPTCCVCASEVVDCTQQLASEGSIPQPRFLEE